MRDQRVREMTRAAGDGPAGVLRLCDLAVDALAMTGAGLSVTNGPGRHSKLAATDDVSDRIEDLQVLLGQGPCVDAVSSGAPVLVGNIGEPQVERRWPVFAPAAAAIGVQASFSLPLLVGDMRLGAMDLYRDVVGTMDQPQVEEAQDFARAAVNVLLRQQQTSSPGQGAGGPASSAVYQATGMIMVQLDTDAEGAFAALRARAFQEGRPLPEVARDVIERRVRLADGEV